MSYCRPTGTDFQRVMPYAPPQIPLEMATEDMQGQIQIGI